jgi:hypothetical protein
MRGWRAWPDVRRTWRSDCAALRTTASTRAGCAETGRPCHRSRAALKFAVLDLPDGTVSVRWFDPTAAFSHYRNASLDALGLELAATCERLATAEYLACRHVQPIACLVPLGGSDFTLMPFGNVGLPPMLPPKPPARGRRTWVMSRPAVQKDSLTGSIESMAACAAEKSQNRLV